MSRRWVTTPVVVRQILGVGLAAGLGFLVWEYNEEAFRWVRNTVLADHGSVDLRPHRWIVQDLRWPITVVVVVAMLWLAEALWGALDRLLPSPDRRREGL